MNLCIFCILCNVCNSSKGEPALLHVENNSFMHCHACNCITSYIGQAKELKSLGTVTNASSFSFRIEVHQKPVETRNEACMFCAHLNMHSCSCVKHQMKKLRHWMPIFLNIPTVQLMWIIFSKIASTYKENCFPYRSVQSTDDSSDTNICWCS